MPTVITNAIVEKALKSRGERYDVTDGRQPGLVLRVSQAGVAWQVRNNMRGVKRKMAIGAPPTVTVQTARRIAAELHERIAAGHEPDGRWIEGRWIEHGVVEDRAPVKEVERETRTTWRWEVAVDSFLDDLARYRTAATVADYRQTLRLPELTAAFGARFVADIDARAIARLVRQMHDSGRERQAEKALTIVRRLWRFLADHARQDDSGVTENVVRVIEKPERTAGNRLVTRTPPIEACARIVAICRSGLLPPTTAWALELCVLTAQRRRTVCSVRLDEVDTSTNLAVWRIPADSIKGGRPHAIPLTARMADIVAEARKVSSNGWLFPAARVRRIGGAFGPIHGSTIGHAMAAIPGVVASPHDVRRTFTTAMKARPATELRKAELVLDHLEGRRTVTDVHYDREEYLDDKLDLLIHWSSLLEPEIERQATSLDLKEIGGALRNAYVDRKAKGAGKPRRRTKASEDERRWHEEMKRLIAFTDDLRRSNEAAENEELTVHGM